VKTPIPADDPDQVPAHEELVAQALEAMPEDPLDNRWAAFTDDELAALAERSDELRIDDDAAATVVRLMEEARTELGKRRGS
jgi:hypothetical protein